MLSTDIFISRHTVIRSQHNRHPNRLQSNIIGGRQYTANEILKNVQLLGLNELHKKDFQFPTSQD